MGAPAAGAAGGDMDPCSGCVGRTNPGNGSGEDGVPAPSVAPTMAVVSSTLGIVRGQISLLCLYCVSLARSL